MGTQSVDYMWRLGYNSEKLYLSIILASGIELSHQAWEQVPLPIVIITILLQQRDTMNKAAIIREGLNLRTCLYFQWFSPLSVNFRQTMQICLQDLGFEDLKKQVDCTVYCYRQLYFSFSGLLYMNKTKKAMTQGRLFGFRKTWSEKHVKKYQ